MNPLNSKLALSRRQFLNRVSLVVGATPAFCAFPAIAAMRQSREQLSGGGARIAAPPIPVVSFHVDQPYLDKSGSALAYVPPAGTRSGQAVGELSDVEYWSRYVYR